jgi:hypothetical protein
MRIFLRGLTMTAVVLSASASYAADQNSRAFVGDAEAEYYGEEYAPQSQAVAPAGSEEGSVSQASAVAHVGDEVVAPVNAGVRSASNTTASAPYHAAGLRKVHASHIAAASCETGCDGSCDGACDGGCKTRSRLTKMMSGKCPDLWLQAETLLWFPQGRTTIPLVAVAPAGEDAVLTNPNAVVVGSESGNNLSPGIRLDFGKYFGDGNFGIGGRFWMLSEDDDSYALAGDGTTQTIARPYFDTFLGIENAVRIGSEQGGNDDFTGSVSGQESLQIVAAEAYARLNLGRGREYHTDLLGGYSYFSIDNDLSIRSTSIDNENGGVTTFRDSFDVTNDFHGGQIGAETILSRGRWVARSLTKVHLGNMNQQVAIDGDATRSSTRLFHQCTPFR